MRIAGDGPGAEEAGYRQLIDALRASEERYRELFDNASDILYTHDLLGNFISVNRRAKEALGYSAEDLLGMNIADVVAPEHLGRTQQMILRKLAQQDARPDTVYDLDVLARDGRRVPLEVSTRLIFVQGRPVGVQGSARDVTERRRLQARLLHDASHDALTGLPNRLLFLDRLGQAMARTRRGDRGPAVLFLDLDNFKLVNDSLGHETGDRLLVTVADRLRECLRPSDTVARLGGDEFTVLLEGADRAAEATLVAGRIAEALRAPFDLGGSQVLVDVSIGIALSGPEYARPDDLLRDADAALYQAKGAGKRRFAVFESSMGAWARERLTLETSLRQATERGEFLVHYQPIVDLATEHIVQLEALVRWQHPERGLISPAEFIPIAEETGQIVPIGMFVLEQACREAAAWPSVAVGAAPSLSVNLSLRQLRDPALVGGVARALRESGLEPDRLTFEITESAAMTDAEATSAILDRLKALGARLAIDDFGTGFSDLSRLRRLPVDALKIDRSLVDVLGDDPQDSAIVRSMAALGRSLDLTLTAEGIETVEQLRHLRALGCDRGQGYYFSCPVEAEAVAGLIRGSAPRTAARVVAA